MNKTGEIALAVMRDRERHNMPQTETGTRMQAHTPGPWRTGDLFHTVFGPPNGTPCPEVIADVHSKSGRKQANARLIAAAPEMLKALERLINCHTGAPWQTEAIQRKAWGAAQAAIRKARGEV